MTTPWPKPGPGSYGDQLTDEQAGRLGEAYLELVRDDLPPEHALKLLKACLIDQRDPLDAARHLIELRRTVRATPIAQIFGEHGLLGREGH